MRKKTLFIVGTIIAICLLGLAVYAGISLFAKNSTTVDTQSNQSSKVIPASVCDDQVIVAASSALAENDLSSLSAVANKVMGISQYQNDANCEYIVVRYYLSSGQADKAGDAIDQLQRVLSAGGAYSTVFNPPAINISDLRSTLETERQQQKSNATKVGGSDLTNMDDAYAKSHK